MKTFFLIVLAFFIISASFSQRIYPVAYQEMPTDTVLLNRNQSILISKDNPIEEAKSFAKELMIILKTGDDPAGTLKMINDMVSWLMDHDNVDQGKEIMDKTIAFYCANYDTVKVNYANTFSNLAYYYYLQRDIKNLNVNLTRSSRILRSIDNNHPLLIHYYINKSMSHLTQRQLEKGVAYGDSALMIANANNLHYYKPMYYMNLANTIKYYEPHLAKEYTEYASYYADKYQKKYYKKDIYFHTNIGVSSFAVDEFDKALKAFKKGEEAISNGRSRNIKLIQTLYYYLGVTYKSLKEYDESIRYLDSARIINKEQFGEKHADYLSAKYKIAEVQLLKGENKSALEELLAIVDNVKLAYGPDDYKVVPFIMADIARAYENLGNYESALAQYHKTIQYIYSDSTDENVYQVHSGFGSKAGRKGLFDAYLGKIGVLKKLYAEHKDDSLLNRIFQHGNALIKELNYGTKQGLVELEDMQVMSNVSRKLTNEILAFLVTENLSKERIKEAYRIISYSKSFALLASLSAENDPIIDAEKEIELKALKMKLLNSNLSGEEYEELMESRLTINTQLFLKGFNSDVEKEKLAIESKLNSTKGKITSGIQNNETIFDIYFTDNYLYCFAFNSDSFELYSKPKAELEKSVHSFLKELKTAGNIKPVAVELYQQLFSQIEPKFTENQVYTIIPDKELYKIPFEAFIDDSDKYLIESKQIQYRYNSHLHKSDRTQRNVNSFAAFAPVFGEANDDIAQNNPLRTLISDSIDVIRGDGYKLKPLPYSEIESKDAVEKFKNKWKTIVYLYEEANEARFKEVANDYDILHLATHGYVSASEPNKSGLFLSQTDMSVTEDNFLLMSEIYNLKIHADLVVLSACKSGYGKLHFGEGILSLPRAFLASGSKNVVGSLWQVHDQKTQKFMDYFYSNLTDDLDYGKALQKAKVKMIKDNDLPGDWSAFTLVVN